MRMADLLQARSTASGTLRRLRGHKGPVLSLLHPWALGATTSGGTSAGHSFRPGILVSGGADCSVRIWDLAAGGDHCLAALHCHAAPVIALTVGPPASANLGSPHKAFFLSVGETLLCIDSPRVFSLYI